MPAVTRAHVDAFLLATHGLYATIMENIGAEADKRDGWADELKLGLEREIKELDRQI